MPPLRRENVTQRGMEHGTWGGAEKGLYAVNVRIGIVGPVGHHVLERERTAVQLVEQHDVVAVGECLGVDAAVRNEFELGQERKRIDGRRRLNSVLAKYRVRPRQRLA